MLSDGLRISLEGQVEKRCPSLGRDAIYTLKKKINKLVSNILSHNYSAVLSVCAFREILLEARERNSRN